MRRILDRKFSAVVFALAVAVASCRTLAPGADPVVVEAERVRGGMFTLTKSFLALERAERKNPGAAPFLNKPSIHVFAEKLRGAECGIAPTVEGQERLDALAACPGTAYHAFKRGSDLIAAYKSNRTPEAEADVITWMRAAESLAKTVSEYLNGT